MAITIEEIIDSVIKELIVATKSFFKDSLNNKNWIFFAYITLIFADHMIVLDYRF